MSTDEAKEAVMGWANAGISAIRRGSEWVVVDDSFNVIGVFTSRIAAQLFAAAPDMFETATNLLQKVFPLMAESDDLNDELIDALYLEEALLAALEARHDG